MKTKPKERVRHGEDSTSLPGRLTKTLASLGMMAAMVAAPMLAVAEDARNAASVSDAARSALIPTCLFLLVLVFANGLFVAAEIAVGLLRNGHVRALEKEDARHKRLLAVLAIRTQAVAGLTLCRQTVQWWLVIFSFVPALSIASATLRRLDGSLEFWPVVGAWLAVGIPIAALNIVMGELVPRTYAARNPASVALRLSGLITVCSRLFYGPSQLMMALASLVTARFGATASFSVVNQAEEEIKSLAESASESGELEQEEKELLHSVFEFTDTVAREIMTPRVDMDTAPVTAQPSDLIRLIQESGRSRIPVYEETDDQIIGIIHAKDLLAARLDDSRPVNLRTLLRSVVFVPENKNINDLLRELRTNRTQIAIVQDEFGGTAGLVTIEDIVEELVGEIVDEYDNEAPEIMPHGAGWIVSGKVNLYDLNEQIGSSFESDEFDTIGGYVFGLFGRQPRQGDEVIEEGYAFRVSETDGRRISSLLIEKAKVDNLETGSLEVI